MESEELPPQTKMCEVSTTNEFQGENTLGLLLPTVSRSHDIMRDTTETDRPGDDAFELPRVDGSLFKA